MITVGREIGAPLTIALIVLTATLGVVLLRHQGLRTFATIKDALQRGELPAVALLEGLVLLVAGALLLTPGFATDAVGFACLTPSIRTALAEAALKYYVAHHLSPDNGKYRENKPTEISRDNRHV